MKPASKVFFTLLLMWMVCLQPIKAQETYTQQEELIERINENLKKAARFKTSVKVLTVSEDKLVFTDHYHNSYLSFLIAKLKRVKRIKSDGYYQVKIFAPWGVQSSINGPDSYGGTGVVISSKKKEAIVQLVADLSTLIESLKSE